MSTLTTQQKSDIDKLWTEFWTGGIINPLTVIEQISFLMFSRLLDVMETTAERRAERTKKPFKGRFDGPNDPRRWKNFKQLPATVTDSDRKNGLKGMLEVVRDDVFTHFRQLDGGTTFSEYMQDAQLMIQKPNLLVQAVLMIDKLPITEGDAKGDLYEYLLSKLTTAGINGQFRTPRHVIRFMVDLLEPKPTETVGDPACGTAGFLVGVSTCSRPTPRRRASSSGRAARRSTPGTCSSRTARTSRAGCSTASTSTRPCSGSRR
jgi:type I restriction enzyme M protein